MDPIGIFLVKTGGTGDRVLFRYPYEEKSKKKKRKQQHTNPDLPKPEEDPIVDPEDLEVCATPVQPEPVNPIPKNRGGEEILCDLNLEKFPDDVLASIFAKKPEFCGEKIDIRIDDVRFVGQAVCLDMTEEEKTCYPNQMSGKHKQSIATFTVVFALTRKADHSIIKCYYELAQELADRIQVGIY